MGDIAFSLRSRAANLASPPDARAIAWAALGLAAGAVAVAAAGRRREPAPDTQPNRHTGLPQLEGTPARRYYTGGDLSRAVSIADLRARTHRRMPRFVLEYLEGGAEDEATMMRERAAYADWRFLPRTLVDVSER